MRRFLLLQTVLILLLGVGPVGCGDDHDDHANNHEHENHDDHDHDDHDGEEHVCVHFESGPMVDITAEADATADLPETFEEHTRIDVTFPGGEDTAFVKWTPEEAGEFKFWRSQDVPFALLDGQTELTPEGMGGAAKGCEMDAVVHSKYDVEAKSYTIRIGPGAAEGMISFATEHAAHDGEHEDHDHEEHSE